jgi:2,3-diketo-5-methylthio-1-phosphopentane phosphatase
VPRAHTPPDLPPDGAPVSFLVDYDGTISRLDVGDTLLTRHVDDAELVAAKDADYDAGRVGSRELMQWDMDVLPRDADLLRTEAAAMPHDTAFPRFVEAIRARGAAIEIVSDGLGFYVESNLADLGITDVPIATNENRVEGGGAGLTFPYGHPRCYVCGTCKRERVRMHRGADRAVVFIGDGTSDRFAAAHADVVFAKESLARMCDREGWPYHAWRTLAEVERWFRAALSDGDLPRSASEFDAWRGRGAPGPRPFICGPEVWGPGRTTPGPGPGTTAGAPSSLDRRGDPG